MLKTSGFVFTSEAPSVGGVGGQPPGDPSLRPYSEVRKLKMPAARVVADGETEKIIATEMMQKVANCKAIFADPGFDLPMLPSSAMRVLNLVQEAEASPRKIAQTLQLDPVLTAKFLRLANSPMYAGNRRVENVQFAIDRLGLETVKSVVLAIALNGAIAKEKRLGHHGAALWEHALGAGAATQALAARLGMAQSTAFILGMMHDIGKLPAWIMFNEILERIKIGVRPEFAKSIIEEVHTTMGDALLSAWSMPPDVRMAAGGHHCISSLDDAKAYVLQNTVDTSMTQVEAAAVSLCLVTVADQTLAALSLSDEPGNRALQDVVLLQDIGVSQPIMAEYLLNVPKLVAENKVD
jgi:HD-like signal output (HDOD) protein